MAGFVAILVAAAWLPPGDAFACPDCPTARVVRASVLGQDFWTHLYLISLPLLVLGVISALLYPIGIERKTKP